MFSYSHYIIPSHSRRREEARGLPPLLLLVSLRFTRFVFAFERSITFVYASSYSRRSNLLSPYIFHVRIPHILISPGCNVKINKIERERERYRFIHSATLLKYQAKCRRIIRRASPRLLWWGTFFALRYRVNPRSEATRLRRRWKREREGEGEGEGTKTRDVYLPFVALCSWLYQIGGRLTRHELDF